MTFDRLLACLLALALAAAARHGEARAYTVQPTPVRTFPDDGHAIARGGEQARDDAARRRRPVPAAGVSTQQLRPRQVLTLEIASAPTPPARWPKPPSSVDGVPAARKTVIDLSDERSACEGEPIVVATTVDVR